MTIYFIQAGEGGAIKIGYTSGPATARLATLQTGCPHELRLRAALEEARRALAKASDGATDGRVH